MIVSSNFSPFDRGSRSSRSSSRFKVPWRTAARRGLLSLLSALWEAKTAHHKRDVTAPYNGHRCLGFRCPYPLPARPNSRRE